MKLRELRKVGLTEYEENVYLALLELGPSNGIEISKKSKVPKTRVYDVLKSLAEKGLASIIQEKPLIFKAVRPEIGVKRLFESKIKEIEDSEAKAIKFLKSIKTKPKIIPKIHEKVIPVLGFKKMFDVAVSMINKAKKEYSVFSVGEKVPYSLGIAVRRAVARGVKCRLIVTKCDEENIHILKGHAAMGFKLRHYPSTGEWTFCVVDKKLALINVRNPKVKEERFSIYFEVPGLAKSLAEYYEILWKKAKPVKL